MKKIALSLLPFALLLGSATAQEQSGEIQSDISGEVSSLEMPPVKIDLGIGYQSNIDLLDPTKYSNIKYQNSQIMNIGASTNLKSEIAGKALSYSTSLKAIVLQESNYDKSSDILRRVNFNNNLFLNLMTEGNKLSLGPTLDLNAEKRFSHYGWHRKRDNVNSFVGVKSDLKASSQLMLSASTAFGYVDHSGNYVSQTSGFRKFERELEEDRSVYKANITGVFKASNALTLSMPISYQRDNFTEKRARAAKLGPNPGLIDQDLATWTTATGQPYIDEALDMQNIAAGLGAEIAMGEVTANMAYTYLDDREMNVGHGRNNADTDNYELGLSSTINKANVSLSYANENIHYNNLAAGAIEITQTYATDVKIAELIKDMSTNLKLSYTDYQFSDGTGATEKAEDIVAMIGVSATL